MFEVAIVPIVKSYNDMKLIEHELATHFINRFLPDFDVYKEVPAGGIIDIVSKKGGIVSAYEVKTSFSFDVIEQAEKNKRFAHFSYVVVPATKIKSFAYKICRDYGIGVITIRVENGILKHVQEVEIPRINRNIKVVALHDWMKLNKAGVQSGRITPFGNTVMEITALLKRKPGNIMLTSEVLMCIRHHYNSHTSAKSSLMQMCSKGVIKDFYFEKGYMKLAAASVE